MSGKLGYASDQKNDEFIREKRYISVLLWLWNFLSVIDLVRLFY